MVETSSIIRASLVAEASIDIGWGRPSRHLNRHCTKRWVRLLWSSLGRRQGSTFSRNHSMSAGDSKTLRSSIPFNKTRKTFKPHEVSVGCWSLGPFDWKQCAADCWHHDRVQKGLKKRALSGTVVLVLANPRCSCSSNALCCVSPSDGPVRFTTITSVSALGVSCGVSDSGVVVSAIVDRSNGVWNHWYWVSCATHRPS